MTRGALNNYIKASPKTGRLSYRRRIPSKLQPHFKKEDGSLRGLEWNETLGTKSRTVALRKATTINERFERTKALAKQLELTLKSNQATSKQQSMARVVDYFFKKGIHPDQAPDIFASDSDKMRFLDKSAEAQRELMEYQELVGIEVVGELAHETYHTNDQYHEIQAQIDFLRGNRSGIKSLLKPTWDVAVDEYLNKKSAVENNPSDFLERKNIKRIIRISNDFARSLGKGSLDSGNQHVVSEISRQDTKLFIDQQIERGRTAVTVGRDLVPLSAIYSLMQKEYGKRDSDLVIHGNPFSGLRGDLDKRDKTAVRTGARKKISARAWSASEVNKLKELVPKMNEEAGLCVKLAMFTGARLHDVCGLMVDELLLKDEENSLINIKHNAWRSVSKDSIERKIPVYGEMLRTLRDYVANRDFSESKKLTPRYAKTEKSAAALSSLVNQRYIDKYITEDPTLIPHGFRNTLQAKFDASDVTNKVSGYLIGWKDQQTVGMQREYNRQGYPHAKLLSAIKACHDVTDWAT